MHEKKTNFTHAEPQHLKNWCANTASAQRKEKKMICMGAGP